MTLRPTLSGRIAAAALAAVLMALPASAVTINEPSVAGGDFSDNWAAPSAIGFGYDIVNGQGSSSDPDYLVFTSMTPGAQSLSLTFTMPAGPNPLGFAGGTVQYSFAPFTSATDGLSAGGYFLTSYAPTQTLTLALGAGFAGTLYLGITTLIGNNIGYSITAAGNVLPASPVPLPASAALLAAALAGAGGFGALRRSRRRTA